MDDYRAWSEDDAASHIAVPHEGSDKYSRGVLGVITGSEKYPGAAVLSVDAALHTGVGMVRYLGPERANDLVLQRSPETVTGAGRVQAWLMGSGIDQADHPRLHELAPALAQPVPTVIDGGALELYPRAVGPTVLTPHFGELARLLGVNRQRIAADPGFWARDAADRLDVTVLLKGHTTFVAGPAVSLSVSAAPAWLATAGAGDALAGILGALVATHSVRIAENATTLARLAATAAMIHGRAAERASAGGPFTIRDLVAAIPATVAALVH